jgi:hypothetical protein
MHRGLLGIRVVLLSAVLIGALAYCGNGTSPGSSRDASTPAGKRDGGGASDAGTDDLMLCNDGTEKSCCPATARSGAACKSPIDSCWTKCSGGFTSQASCSGGTWNFGKGLFPCGPTTPVPCDDGTGRKDCCPVAPASGGVCNFGSDTCWTKCKGGFTSQASCVDSAWSLGHGLFPCGADAGAPTTGNDAGQ